MNTPFENTKIRSSITQGLSTMSSLQASTTATPRPKMPIPTITITDTSVNDNSRADEIRNMAFQNIMLYEANGQLDDSGTLLLGVGGSLGTIELARDEWRDPRWYLEGAGS
ncbi:hypothetical protein LTS10_004537 [Elasticomyces elasticus]|nr:hypothetical protein LTS10_004537 [Elasticomyces elasticus]